MSVRHLASRIPSLCCLLMAVPYLLWIALDRAPFGGDQSQYATEAVTLFDTLIHSPSRWPSAMAHTMGFKPPGIAWIGQLFVPVGVLLGSIDAGLLLLIAGCLLFALLLTFHSLRELADDGAVALVGCLVVASAPLTLQLVHEFLVEAFQMMATAYFVFVMAVAPRWDRARAIAHLLLATPLALLAKASSPLFCFAPGLLALAWAVAPSRQPRPWGWSRRSTVVPLAAGSLLTLATLVWYQRNLAGVRAHVAAASSGPVALVWGKDEPFIPTLAYWVGEFGDGFFFGPIDIVVTAAFAVAAVIWLFRRRPLDHFTACAAVALLEIAAVLAVFSMNQTRVPRFLLPVLPHCAMLLGWTLAELRSAIATGTAALVLTVQFVLAHGNAFGGFQTPSLARWIRPIDTRGVSRAVLDGIVDRTCTGTAPGPHRVIIAIDPSFLMADWPAPPPATYVAAKRALLTRKPAACSFDYAGGGFFGGTAAQAWRDMVSERRARYFVTVDPRVYPVPARVYNRALDSENFPLLLHKIEESGLFEAEPALQQDRGIRIFRRLDRPDLITLGRALSDERRHDQAIERLREASRSEPDDAEAWANLQLACERRGQLDDAIAAGKRGLQLKPDHYYLNHGLARAYAAQGRWTKAIRHGERAAAAAPTAEARAEVLALCGRAWLAKGDVDKGCRLLREAGQLPADGTSHPCLSGR